MSRLSVSFIFIIINVLGLASGENIDLPWCIPPTMPTSSSYSTHYAKVGDIVSFDWKYSYHDVFIHPEGECELKDAQLVGTSGADTSYTFTSDDVGNITFACDVSDHCQLGMLVMFEVVADGTDVDYSANTNPCPRNDDSGSSASSSVGSNAMAHKYALVIISVLSTISMQVFG